MYFFCVFLYLSTHYLIQKKKKPACHCYPSYTSKIELDHMIIVCWFWKHKFSVWNTFRESYEHYQDLFLEVLSSWPLMNKFSAFFYSIKCIPYFFSSWSFFKELYQVWKRWIIIGFFVYLNINVYIYVSGSCFHPVMSFAIVDKCLFSDTSSDDRIQCIEKEIVFDFFFNMRCVLREITLRDVNFYVNVFQFSKHICLCKSTHTPYYRLWFMRQIQ